MTIIILFTVKIAYLFQSFAFYLLNQYSFRSFIFHNSLIALFVLVTLWHQNLSENQACCIINPDQQTCWINRRNTAMCEVSHPCITSPWYDRTVSLTYEASTNFCNSYQTGWYGNYFFTPVVDKFTSGNMRKYQCDICHLSFLWHRVCVTRETWYLTKCYDWTQTLNCCRTSDPVDWLLFNLFSFVWCFVCFQLL